MHTWKREIRIQDSVVLLRHLKLLKILSGEVLLVYHAFVEHL